MAQWFWRWVNIFLLFHYYSPKYGVVLHLNKHESPLPKHALRKGWLKLAHWFLGRRWKWWLKVNRWTDIRRSEMFTWAFRSCELKTEMETLYEKRVDVFLTKRSVTNITKYLNLFYIWMQALNAFKICLCATTNSEPSTIIIYLYW